LGQRSCNKKRNIIDKLKEIPFERLTPSDKEFLDIHQIPTREGRIDLVRLFPDSIYAPHIHEETDSDVTIIAGNGTVSIGNSIHSYTQGSKFVFPKGIPHGFKVETETYMLAIQNISIQREDSSLDLKYT
jgi:quercetin dioxygenase-like cupin family protein